MIRNIALVVTFGAVVAGVLPSPSPVPALAQQRQITPEQRAAFIARREAEMKAPRPIEALDSVWMEELTWMEIRDAISDGKTTALILTGGVESNGPHLATGKHNIALKVVGEQIARKLSNALVAPIVTLEPGRPEGEFIQPGSVFLSRETYKAVLTDMSLSLKSMGFTNVVMMGDSGGNQAPMKEVVESLNARFRGEPAEFHFIPEYYDYPSVRRFIKANGIAEEMEDEASYGSDGIHEEYSIDAIMMLHDPESVRLEQRKAAGKTTINGVDLLPLDKTLDMARKIVELRASSTVAAIEKSIAARSSN